ncbi:STS14 protein [Camellia lanceoleosa]|uniref:STS14 protein n=1 Tax=Camellia lanceoleosa TaxID=1840588 RepID=A0ACC0I3A6_9ERIC|nr:STS14 protein [Camellia lanceoleosa]
MAEIILALVVGLALSQTTSHGAAPAPAPPPNTTVDFLEPHNQARAEVGVEPLKWSEKLANGTSLLVRYQRNKMGCNFANLTGSKYRGEPVVGEWVGGCDAARGRGGVGGGEEVL